MIPHGHPWLVAAILIVTFALANRLWGAGDKGGKLHLKALAIALACAGTCAIHWPLAIFAIGWFAWRSPPPALIGASLAPSPGQVPSTLLRHTVLSAIGFFAAMLILKDPWWTTFVASAAFGILAAFDARENALQSARGRDINWLCELTTGAGYGALAGVMAVLS